MSQKVPVNNFEQIKNYNEESDEGYRISFSLLFFFLPFLPERMKIEKIKKLVANLNDKTEHVIQIRNLKQGLNNG